MPRPKFSLLSLLLFTLLLASASLLYFHFHAWRITRTIAGHFVDIAAFPDGNRVLASRLNRTAVLLDTSGNEITELPVEISPARWTEFSADSQYVMIKSPIPLNEAPPQCTLKCLFWNTHTYQLLDESLTANVCEATLSPDSRFLFTHSVTDEHDNRVATLKHFPSGTIVHTWKNVKLARCRFTSKAPFALVQLDDDLHIFDLLQKRGLRKIPAHYSIAYDDDFTRLAYWNHDTQSAEVFDARTMKQLRSIRPELNPPQLMCWGMAIDQGELLIAFYLNNRMSAQRWDLATGTLLKEYDQTSSTDARPKLWTDKLFVCAETYDGYEVDVWNRDTGEHFENYVSNSYTLSPQLLIYSQKRIFMPPLRDPVAELPNDAGSVTFIPHQYAFWAIEKNTGGNIHVYTRTRPEEWYGLAWLPAFWTTLLLAILFLWNLFRRTK